MICFRSTVLMLLLFLFVSSAELQAQSEKKEALKGNNNYETGMDYMEEANKALVSGDSVKFSEMSELANKHFLDAEVNYKKALDKKQDFLKADFNLGDALYKQGRYDEAISKFDEIINKTDNKGVKGGAHHNIGNAQLQNFMKDPQNNQSDLDKSIESFKNALRNNPADQEARYNLEMSKRLKQQMQQQQQQSQNNQDKNQQQQEQEQQQQQQEKKDDKKEQDKEQQQQQENKDDKKEQDEEQQQPKTGEMSKEDAERLLEALKNEEEKLQDKLKKKKETGGKKYIEKDW